MKKSKKLEGIFKQIAKFEKESPYNFCNRWCERCVHEKQARCTLYKDDLERKISCIAHGRDEDDPEITEAVMEAQYKGLEEKLNEQIDKFGIDPDSPDIGEDDLDEPGMVVFEEVPPEIQKHIRYIRNNALDAAAHSSSAQSHDFLKEAFYENKDVPSELKYDFETVSWYQTLLPAKVHRALCGFHEPVTEGDISLCDAVAQFNICMKGITGSINALRNISNNCPKHKDQTKLFK